MYPNIASFGVVKMSVNYVIYNRNNYNLGLSNHIDQDGDLDAQYALLRNVALTGTIRNGKFISSHKKHFGWVVECAKKGCPICNGIFKNVKTNDLNIKPFYLKNVVKVVDNSGKEVNIEVSEWDQLAKNVVKTKKSNDPNRHPLFDQIMEVFNGTEIK